jgi:hypothetical protein
MSGAPCPVHHPRTSIERRWTIPDCGPEAPTMRINDWKEFFGFVALAISALFTPLDG